VAEVIFLYNIELLILYYGPLYILYIFNIFLLSSTINYRPFLYIL